MKKSNIAVLGLGRFGWSVASTLLDLGHEVIGVDQDPVLIQDYSPFLTHTVQADVAHIESLREIGIQNCDAVIVAIGSNVEASIVTTMLVKELGVPFIIAKANNDLHGKVLEKIGVDEVVFPEKDMGVRIGYHLASPSIVEYLSISANACMVEVEIPSAFVGKQLIKYAFEISIRSLSRRCVVVPRCWFLLHQKKH